MLTNQVILFGTCQNVSCAAVGSYRLSEIQGDWFLSAQNRVFDTVIGPSEGLLLVEMNCVNCGHVCVVALSRSRDH